MATPEQIDAWKDLAIVEALYREQLLGSEYIRVWCAKRGLRSRLQIRARRRALALLAAANRRHRVADKRAAVIGAIVRHVNHLEAAGWLS